MIGTDYREIRHAHFFCGLGGGARGFNRGEARVGNMVARFRCIGGIDVDPASIADFERLAGVPGTVMDLFSREQYAAFHGREPGPDWREATTSDIHRAFGGERPHIVFLSAPCKGFSGLLAEKQSKTDKYQALNELTLRGVWLMLEAYAGDPPELIIFENVPRIATRGRSLLDQIMALLRTYGYATAETTHDCGELGELAQSRKRFLLVARHAAKVPPYLYEPKKRRLRGVGEVLDLLPLPGDPRAGVMHRVPSLQWQTWVRLAFVEAGADWRSLNKLVIENGVLRDFGIMPETTWQAGVLGVTRWSEPTGVIAGRSGPTNGNFAVADPREDARRHHGAYGVQAYDDPAGTVRGASKPANGVFAVADPRGDQWATGQSGVRAWDEPTGVVTAARSPLQGGFSVADPRPMQDNQTFGQYGVKPWGQNASAVTGQSTPGGGPYSVADPRIGQDGPRFSNVFRIVPWDDQAPAVTSARGALAAVADPRPAPRDDYKQNKYRVTGFEEPSGAVIAASTTGNGGYAVADPRCTWGPESHTNKLKVVDYDASAPTVTGSDRVGSGACSVADPRLPDRRNGALGVTAWGEPTGVVAGETHPTNGRFAVADPRGGPDPDQLHGKHRVEGWDQPSRAVIAGRDNGASAVADPRPVALNAPGREGLGYSDHYGVLNWADTSKTVAAAASLDNGSWSVADPRETGTGDALALPAAKDRLVAVIRARDGTWHRPFTTLELAALQSLVDPEEVSAGTFVLEGASDSGWRERIGNAVPSAAAQQIASVMGQTLLLAWSGETFMLSTSAIWVQPLQIALAIDDAARLPFLDGID